jgi:uncharacterized glyoxalase superfamily protein PhnB
MTRTGIACTLALATALSACGGGTQSSSTTPNQGGDLPNPPPGFFTLTPSLVVNDVDAAVDYYTRVFGATKRFSMPGPDGKTMHAEIQLGDSIVMIGPEMADMGARSAQTLGGSPGSLLYYVPDADAVIQAATDAGATVGMPAQDMFWGDRWGTIVDPFGHNWQIATHKEELTPEQMAERMKAMQGQQVTPTPGTPAKSHQPAQYHSVTPAITAADAKALIAFYEQAFGAKEISRMPTPDGRIMHAEVKLGDSILMLGDTFPGMPQSKSAKDLGGSPFGLMMYVPDADATFQKATAAGAEARQQPQDAFWGDRYAEVLDPSGNPWSIATPKEQLTPEQIDERMKAQFGGAGASQQ